MAVKYQKYPEYKDSGVEWVGDAPSHWQTLKFKCAITEKKKTLAPHLPAGSISFGSVIYKNEDNLALETKASYQEVLAGEFLLNPLNLNYDVLSLRTALSEIDVVVSTGYMVLLNSPTMHSKFLRWCLHQFDVGHMKTLGAGVRQTVNFSDVGNSLFSLPPIPEQIQIAKFLDHETGKIDRLIEKQQELIALLKEKRQAVISHAVTKGLNPNAPLKPSNIEWLGDVPEHWNVPHIGYCAFVTKLTGFEYTNVWKIKEDGEVIALRGFNIKERQIELNDVERISYDLSTTLTRSKLAKGDIVFPCTGTIGNAAVIEEDDKFHINQNIAKIRFSETINSRFAIYWLTSSFIRTLIDRNNTSAMQPVVLIGDIRKLPIPRFDYPEQESIADYLDSAVNRFNMLISEAESATELMQERRTALISAAVTGKIDVREWSNSTAD